MKKTKIIFNIFMITIIFLVADFLSYCLTYKDWVSIFSAFNMKKPKFDYSIIIKPYEENYLFLKNNKFRKPEGEKYKKPSIIVFGCSYIYGYKLRDDQTFSYKLSKKTERPVYNRSYVGLGLQHMLYDLKTKDIYKEIKDAEYIIYVFIPDHIRRIHLMTFDSPHIYNYEYLSYGYKNGKIVERSALAYKLVGFSLIKRINLLYSDKYLTSEKMNDKNFDIVKEIFKESKKEAKKHYKNSKFIIIKYHSKKDNWYLNTERWKELEKEGFIVLDTKQLTGENLYEEKYHVEPYKDDHPSESAWDLITPQVAKIIK